MRRLGGRTWQWGRGRADEIAAAVLVAVAAGILSASGLLASALPASLSLLAFLALVAERSRHPIFVGVIGGALLALPTLMGDATALNNSAVALPGLLAVFLIAYSLGANCQWALRLLG